MSVDSRSKQFHPEALRSNFQVCSHVRYSPKWKPSHERSYDALSHSLRAPRHSPQDFPLFTLSEHGCKMFSYSYRSLPVVPLCEHTRPRHFIQHEYTERDAKWFKRNSRRGKSSASVGTMLLLSHVPRRLCEME